MSYTQEKNWRGYEQLLLVPLIIGSWIAGLIIIASIPAPLLFLVKTITSDDSSFFWAAQLIIDSAGSGIVSYLLFKYLFLHHLSRTTILFGCGLISPIIWWLIQLQLLHFYDGAEFPISVLFLFALVVSAITGAYISFFQKEKVDGKVKQEQIGVYRPASLRRRLGAIVFDAFSFFLLLWSYPVSIDTLA